MSALENHRVAIEHNTDLAADLEIIEDRIESAADEGVRTEYEETKDAIERNQRVSQERIGSSSEPTRKQY